MLRAGETINQVEAEVLDPKSDFSPRGGPYIRSVSRSRSRRLRAKEEVGKRSGQAIEVPPSSWGTFLLIVRVFIWAGFQPSFRPKEDSCECEILQSGHERR